MGTLLSLLCTLKCTLSMISFLCIIERHPAEEMTFDCTTFADELFVKDKIHLNHEGQLLWMKKYIWPMLDRLLQEYGLDHLKQ